MPIVNGTDGLPTKKLRVPEELGALHILHQHPPHRIFQEPCHIVSMFFGSTFGWAAYTEGYDVGSIADAVVNGDDGFHATAVDRPRDALKTLCNSIVLIYNDEKQASVCCWRKNG